MTFFFVAFWEFLKVIFTGVKHVALKYKIVSCEVCTAVKTAWISTTHLLPRWFVCMEHCISCIFSVLLFDCKLDIWGFLNTHRDFLQSTNRFVSSPEVVKAQMRNTIKIVSVHIFTGERLLDERSLRVQLYKLSIIFVLFQTRPNCSVLPCSTTLSFLLYPLRQLRSALFDRMPQVSSYESVRIRPLLTSRLPISVTASCQHSFVQWLEGKQQVNQQLSTTQTKCSIGCVSVFVPKMSS